MEKEFDLIMDIRRFGPMLKGIRLKNSPLDWLGKLFFRRSASWEQRRKTVVLLWSIATGLIMGGAVILVALTQNFKK